MYNSGIFNITTGFVIKIYDRMPKFKKKKLVEVNFIKCPILIATGTLKMQVLK